MFPYIGGKSHHAKWIVELFPDDFETFVDVFGGAGWLTVKNTKAIGKRTVYNDFNPLLANVFECFRIPEQLILEMNKIPSSNIDIYKAFQKELFVDLNWDDISMGDFILATKYLYLQTQIFSGTPLSAKNVSYFTDLKSGGKYPSKYETLKRKLTNKKILTSLKSIYAVENKDCVEVIKKYDAPDAFFYIDPPYFKKEFYYTSDFSRGKHAELAALLSDIKGRFALSYYDFPELKMLYPPEKFRWHRRNVYKSSATRSGKDADYKNISSATEILIMNYTCGEV